MKAGETTLQKLLNTSRQFIVPIYQRSYSWDELQYRRLWLDIVHAGSFDTGKTHFIGSVVYIDMGTPAGRPQQLMLIDGQQRLTTISLLICALRRFILANNISSKLFSAAKLQNQFLCNTDETDADRLKLILTQQDAQTYLSLLEETEYTLREPSLRLLSCWHYFNSELIKYADKLDIIFKGILNLSLVSISLDKNTDNPQRIFESMNSTGRDLSQADLLRNFLLMDLAAAQQKKLYKTYWQPMEQAFGQVHYLDSFDNFLRDFLTVQRGRICRNDEIYEVFKRFFAASAQTNEQVLQQLFICARYYVYIALAQEKDRQLAAVWQQLRSVDSGVSYPFFLQLYADYTAGKFDKTTLIDAAKMTVSYLMRRALRSLPAAPLARMFASLHDKLDIRNIDCSMAKFYITQNGSCIFPTDYQVRESLLSKDVYHFKLKNFLLQSLENYQHKEPIDFAAAKYSIEHIMPQHKELNTDWQKALGSNWQEVQRLYLHTLGNLTLTGYNSEMGDKSFAQKKNSAAGFAHSHLLLNKYLAQCAKWDKNAILKRTHLLTDIVLQIWPYPQFKK